MATSTEVAERHIKRSYRATLPPRLDLEEAVTGITLLYEVTGGTASADELAELMGNTSKSSAFRAKQLAIRNFGLVLLDGNQYSLSETGNSIVAPSEKVERVSALKKAFLEIEPFKVVYEKFVGKLLPQDEFLKNSFSQYSGRELEHQWMEAFKSSANFAGLLLDRGDGKLQVRESGKLSLSQDEPEPEKKEIRHVINESPHAEQPAIQILPQYQAAGVQQTHLQMLMEVFHVSVILKY